MAIAKASQFIAGLHDRSSKFKSEQRKEISKQHLFFNSASIWHLFITPACACIQELVTVLSERISDNKLYCCTCNSNKNLDNIFVASIDCGPLKEIHNAIRKEYTSDAGKYFQIESAKHVNKLDKDHLKNSSNITVCSGCIQASRKTPFKNQGGVMAEVIYPRGAAKPNSIVSTVSAAELVTIFNASPLGQAILDLKVINSPHLFQFYIH